MWYLILGHDVPDSLAKRMAIRPAHLERLNRLRDQGRLFVAGPMPAMDSEDPGAAGFAGSAIIADFPSLQEARDWAAQDPYLEAGVYSKVDVWPFKKVLP
jgi:uncharacterized protein